MRVYFQEHETLPQFFFKNPKIPIVRVLQMKDAGYITADMIMVTWRSSGSEKIAQAKADKTSVCVREST